MLKGLARFFNQPRSSESHDRKKHTVEKSKILVVIGGTSPIGESIVKASVKAGHTTFILVDKQNMTIEDAFIDPRAFLLPVDFHDQETLVEAIKLADVVISTPDSGQPSVQHRIIAAIKKAGNVKRFYPSEFGNDVRRTHAVEPAKTEFIIKAQIRYVVEAENIPHTYISSNCLAGYYLSTLAQPGFDFQPRDKVVILGDGNTKAVFNDVRDIGTYTIKTVDDPRTLNKTVYIKPPRNIYSVNELVSLWEKKIKKRLEKVYLSETQVLKKIRESPYPLNMEWAFCHSIFVKGDQTNFEIEPSFGVEASALYPDVKYTTVDAYLNRLV